MTGIERLRAFVAGISPFTVVCGVTSTEYDGESMEEVGVLLRDFLADIADQIERECAEDREAIAWVREHGGIEVLRRMFQDADSRRVELCGALGIDLDKGWSESMAAMRLRLMPEGCSWPRYEDGGLVNLGDRYKCWCGKTHVVSSVSVRKGCSVLNASDEAHTFVVSDGPLTSHGRRVKRPAPEVLDADGAWTRVGDTVYHVKDGSEMTVCGIEGEWLVVSVGGRVRQDVVTHRAPVFAADGEPLEVGQTVWHVSNGIKLTVIGLINQGERQVVKLRLSDDGSFTALNPDQLTHQRPVLDADGEPIRKGERVFGINGGRYRVTSAHDGKVFARHVDGPSGAEVESAGGEGLYRLRADRLTHTKPEIDTWQRIEEDSTLSPEVYCHRNGIDISQKDGTEIFLADTVEPMARDLVRRCRALAERERGE